MVCFYVGRDQNIFVSPESYGDWRSARSRSSVLGTAGRLGEEPKDFSSPENYGDWRSARSRSSVLSGNYRGDRGPGCARFQGVSGTQFSMGDSMVHPFELQPPSSVLNAPSGP